MDAGEQTLDDKRAGNGGSGGAGGRRSVASGGRGGASARGSSASGGTNATAGTAADSGASDSSGREADAATNAGASAEAGSGGDPDSAGVGGEPESAGSGGASADAGMMTDPAATADAGSGAIDAGAPDSGPPEPECGNGTIERDETCDGNCPTTCTALAACVSSTLKGAPSTCDAICEVQEVTQCAANDDCCPEGCTLANDSDCSASCGDTVLSAGEKCEAGSEKPCPTDADCNDGDACTDDDVVGSAMQCSAECSHKPRTASRQADNCCPSGANANNDADCKPACGNRVKETGETCDGDCPTSCARAMGCRREEPMGSASACNFQCVAREITERTDGDGCCPDGANAGNDGDCPDECGDGVVSGDETCDRASRSNPCRANCDDGDPCTDDRRSGTEDECNVVCTNPRISEPIDGDGCCLPGSTGDSDCGAECGNGIVEEEGGENCDYAAAGWNTWECNQNTCQTTGLNSETSYTKRCLNDFDCATNEVCALSITLGALFGEIEKLCLPLCSSSHQCAFPPGYSVFASPGDNRCNSQSECLVACSSTADCPEGLECTNEICH